MIASRQVNVNALPQFTLYRRDVADVCGMENGRTSDATTEDGDGKSRVKKQFEC